MKRQKYTIHQLLELAAKSPDVGDLEELTTFLSRNEPILTLSKNLDKDMILPMLKNRNWSIEKTNRFVKGLPSLIKKIEETQEEILSVSFEHHDYLGFVAINREEAAIIGFMLVRKPTDLESRRAAFRPDGSYDKY